MGVIVFGAIMFLVVLPLTFVLEQAGIIQKDW